MSRRKPNEGHILIPNQRKGIPCISLKVGDSPCQVEETLTLFNVDLQHPSIKSKQFLRCLENWSPEFEAIIAELGPAYLEALHESKSRKVFANYRFVDFEHSIPDVIPPEAERIFFNPKKGDTYFHFYRNGSKFKVDHCRVIYMQANGNTWGIL